MHQTQTAQVTPATETASPTITGSPASLATIALPPTWTPAPILLLPTIFKSPTATGTHYTPTTDPALLAAGCNNLQLIYDVNIPAGSVVRPGESFTKTWKVANNGTCNWVLYYHLVFVSGDQMGGSPSNLGKTIVPGKWTQISVNLKAPKNAGTYTGYWRMGTQTGTPFGVTLSVSIIVGTPTDTPQPTSTPVPTNTPVPPYP
jgi:Ig-like domain from next to BRCA1 gene